MRVSISGGWEGEQVAARLAFSGAAGVGGAGPVGGAVGAVVADDHGLRAARAFGVEDAGGGGEVVNPARHVEEVFPGPAHGGDALGEAGAVDEFDGFFRGEFPGFAGESAGG